MKSLIEYIIEAATKLQRDILFKADGDMYKSPSGHTFTTLDVAMSTGQYYDVVICNGHMRAPEVTSPSGTVNDIKNVKCNYLIFCGPEDADHMCGVDLKYVEQPTGHKWSSIWTWNVDSAVADMNKPGDPQTFWGGSFVNDTELVISQLDNFFKNNDVKHLVVGYGTGIRDGNVRYHMREVIEGGKNKYKTKPVNVTDIAKEFGMPEDPKSNWLKMF